MTTNDTKQMVNNDAKQMPPQTNHQQRLIMRLKPIIVKCLTHIFFIFAAQFFVTT